MRQYFIALLKPLLETTAMKYKNTPKFTKLLKKLSKKYKTLDDDFEKLKTLSISLFHDPNINFDNQGIKEIPGFGGHRVKVYKVKKFACRSLKGGAMSGLRVIYAYHLNVDLIGFIEIYYKGNQKNHNGKLVKQYFAQFC